MSTEVECCPNDDCRSTNFVYRVRNGQGRAKHGDDERYRCEGCGNLFNRPDTKVTNNSRGPNVGLAAALARKGEAEAGESSP